MTRHWRSPGLVARLSHSCRAQTPIAPQPTCKQLAGQRKPARAEPPFSPFRALIAAHTCGNLAGGNHERHH